MVVPDILITSDPEVMVYVNPPELLLELGCVMVNGESPQVFVISKAPNTGATTVT
jgi:hypothetical protein